MKRVLQVLDNLNMGGIQTFIMNVYRHMDHAKVQFDFMVFRDGEQLFENEIINLGGRIYKLPGRKSGLIKRRVALERFFREHQEYRIIHYNTSSLSDIDVLRVAKKCNIPVRIIHSHSTKAPGKKVHTILHYIHKNDIAKVATNYLACGELALKWFYGHTDAENLAKIVPNGIDCMNYKFDPVLREQIRNDLGISDKLVIGQVGRLAEVKNHQLSLKVIKELKVNYEGISPVLLVVGDGPLMNDLKIKVAELGITDEIIFLGNRSDVPTLMQAMDVLIMPSKYEGFPVTALEGQASGLPCVLSNKITNKAKIKNNIQMVDLDAGIGTWCDSILSNLQREPDNRQLFESGYDINSSVSILMKIYFENN